MTRGCEGDVVADAAGLEGAGWLKEVELKVDVAKPC